MAAEATSNADRRVTSWGGRGVHWDAWHLRWGVLCFWTCECVGILCGRVCSRKQVPSGAGRQLAGDGGCIGMIGCEVRVLHSMLCWHHLQHDA
jgi:hypothetical protein